jgi:hypothetical protein
MCFYSHFPQYKTHLGFQVLFSDRKENVTYMWVRLNKLTELQTFFPLIPGRPNMN